MLNGNGILVIESNGENRKPNSTEVLLNEEDKKLMSNKTSVFANLIPESRISAGFGDFSVTADYSGGIIVGCVIATVLFTVVGVSYRYLRMQNKKQEIDSHIINNKLRNFKKNDLATN